MCFSHVEGHFIAEVLLCDALHSNSVAVVQSGWEVWLEFRFKGLRPGGEFVTVLDCQFLKVRKSHRASIIVKLG